MIAIVSMLCRGSYSGANILSNKCKFSQAWSKYGAKNMLLIYELNYQLAYSLSSSMQVMLYCKTCTINALQTHHINPLFYVTMTSSLIWTGLRPGCNSVQYTLKCFQTFNQKTSLEFTWKFGKWKFIYLLNLVTWKEEKMKHLFAAVKSLPYYFLSTSLLPYLQLPHQKLQSCSCNEGK